MPFLHCPLPLASLTIAATGAANADTLNQPPATSLEICCTENVRLMRRSQDCDTTRFALAGKLADVCAALDELAAQEIYQARRHAIR